MNYKRQMNQVDSHNYNEYVNQKTGFNQKKFWKTFGISLLIELLVVVLVVAGVIGYRAFHRNIGDGDEMTETLSAGTFDDARNLLILGTDKSGKLSDVIMVIAVDPDKNTLSLLSVPRDTKVYFDNDDLEPDQYINEDEPYKINAAIGVGGDNFAVQTVINELDIPIHDYMIVNFQAVETIIDELGGIQFDVPQNMYYTDPEQDLYIDLKKGDQLLDGENAVDLLRFRSYVMGDLERNRVQQQFFQEAFAQKFKPKYIGKVPAIYNLINKNIRSNMSLAEILSYVEVLSNMDNREVQTFELPVTISDPFVIINQEEADMILDDYYR